MARIILLLFSLSFAVVVSGLTSTKSSIGGARRLLLPAVSRVPSRLNSNASNENIKQSGKKTTSRSGGISAWGIVALVISAILLSMGTYYFIIFYPLLCAKERKYDVMDSSSV